MDDPFSCTRWSLICVIAFVHVRMNHHYGSWIKHDRCIAALLGRSPILTSGPLATHIVQATVSQSIFDGKYMFRYIYFLRVSLGLLFLFSLVPFVLRFVACHMSMLSPATVISRLYWRTAFATHRITHENVHWPSFL
jgi:hypothetical protein